MRKIRNDNQQIKKCQTMKKIYTGLIKYPLLHSQKQVHEKFHSKYGNRYDSDLNEIRFEMNCEENIRGIYFQRLRQKISSDPTSREYQQYVDYRLL